MREQLPIKQEAMKNLKKEYGNKIIDEVTVDQVIGKLHSYWQPIYDEEGYIWTYELISINILSHFVACFFVIWLICSILFFLSDSAIVKTIYPTVTYFIRL